MLKKKNVGVLTLLNSKIYYKAIVIETWWCWCKQSNVTEQTTETDAITFSCYL